MSLPSVGALTSQVLAVLRSRGGTASIKTIHHAQATTGTLSYEQLAARHAGGKGSEVEYRTRWALVALRRMGTVERLGPGQWRLAEAATAPPTGEGVSGG